MPILLVWNFIKKHWRLLAVAVALLLAFIGGRASVPVQPGHVETMTVEKEVKVVDEKLVEQEVQKRVREIETKLSKRTTETKVTKPDGTKIETKVTDLNVDKKEHEAEVKYVDREVVKTEYVDREVMKKVVVDAPRKDWIVGPIVGLNVKDIGVQNGAFQFGQVGVGLQVQRRVFGDLYVGAWGLHTGTAGAGLYYQF